jgi:hypothetical protein
VAGVRIDLEFRAGTIATVDVRADLPQASRVLAGRTPDEALALLGRLYAVCGQAQRAAAELALCAAGGPALTADRRAALETGVAHEGVVEHLWRLLVDWPRKLGVTGAPDRFAYWYRRIAAREAGWHELERELAIDWIGAPVAPLVEWSELDEFDAWHRVSDTPFARLFAALHAAAPVEAARLAGEGAPETGAVEQYADHGWIAALLGAGRGLEARVAARLVAASALIGALASPAECDSEVELDAASPAERCGRAAVQTARGMLVHDVRLEDGRIASYAIRTPTECNFADGGAYRALVTQRNAADAASAARLADLWALALDPCVPYSVHVDGVTGESGRA